MDHYTLHTITYPREWENEYKSLGYIQCWRDRFPEQFEPWIKSTRPGTCDLFTQYALMYLLRDQFDFRSITWYGLADKSKPPENVARRQKFWRIMQEVMGDDVFAMLHSGVKDITGEPDLFCWHAGTRKWFVVDYRLRANCSWRVGDLLASFASAWTRDFENWKLKTRVCGRRSAVWARRWTVCVRPSKS